MGVRGNWDFNPRSPYGERPGTCRSLIWRRAFQSTLPLRGATRKWLKWQCARGISIHAPLTGSDKPGHNWIDLPIISIHAPLTGSDQERYQEAIRDFISIHAPLTGSDLFNGFLIFPCGYFNPRSPYGERLSLSRTGCKSNGFQSTLPLRGATIKLPHFRVVAVPISIHAPLTGSDIAPDAVPAAPIDFNPRSPYGERLLALRTLQRHYIFQSTLPLRGATRLSGAVCPNSWISIHAPLTGSDGHAALLSAAPAISIHAPLTGSDGLSLCLRDSVHYFNPRSPYGERRAFSKRPNSSCRFQSTLPLRGATWYQLANRNRVKISIHAPLTGSDCLIAAPTAGHAYFNPRSPYGERHIWWPRLGLERHFNPRSPYGERPPMTYNAVDILWISIHAPLTGSDPFRLICKCRQCYFNPRSPYGERPGIYIRAEELQYFNPRSPYGERLLALRTLQRHYIFQSTLPLRGATAWYIKHASHVLISIHAPLTGSDKCNFSGPDNSIISIHAPLTGSDRSKLRSNSRLKNFNPRSPYGERLQLYVPFTLFGVISIHAPLTGSDLSNRSRLTISKISIHAPLTGSDHPFLP